MFSQFMVFNNVYTVLVYRTLTSGILHSLYLKGGSPLIRVNGGSPLIRVKEGSPLKRVRVEEGGGNPLIEYSPLKGVVH